MLLEGWGPCGIPLSQADDTFWLATSPEVSQIFSKSYKIIPDARLTSPAPAATMCRAKSEETETSERKKLKHWLPFWSSAFVRPSESLHHLQKKKSIFRANKNKQEQYVRGAIASEAQHCNLRSKVQRRGDSWNPRTQAFGAHRFFCVSDIRICSDQKTFEA